MEEFWRKGPTAGWDEGGELLVAEFGDVAEGVVGLGGFVFDEGDKAGPEFWVAFEEVEKVPSRDGPETCGFGYYFHCGLALDHLIIVRLELTLD